MADNEKAKLYRAIVQHMDEATLLEQMRLHGFWPEREGLPQDPAAEVAELAQLQAELVQLRKQYSSVKNPDKALAAERKRRWEESKKRRAAVKAKREADQQLARTRWQQQKAANVVHLGEGVSAGLQQLQSDAAALQRLGLPLLQTGVDVAREMGITLGALRWLTYHRRGAAVVHYHRYSIAKKTGGLRCISAPKPALAQAQQWILHRLLNKLPLTEAAHGFVAGRSIVTNATPHVRQPIVMNLDLKDFFPSITFRRVKGLFHKLGYSEHVAVVLALLCTEPPRVAAEVDGKTWHIALGERVLPQGACTSPAITNLLCRRLDRRLGALAARHHFTYTRYADDLTFSGERHKAVGRLLRSVRAILESEGFSEHPSKTRVMHRSRRQEVTGIIVNVRPTVARTEVRRLRAILHNAAKHGLASQNREGRPDFASYLRGKVAYVCMVDPQRGAKLREALFRALAKG